MPEAAKIGAAERRGWIEASLALLATSVFWGSAVPFTSVLLRWFDPFVLASLRMVLSVCLLGVVLRLLERAALFRMPLSWARFATLGFFMSGFNVFYTLGIQHSHPVTAAAIAISEVCIETGLKTPAPSATRLVARAAAVISTGAERQKRS